VGLFLSLFGFLVFGWEGGVSRWFYFPQCVGWRVIICDWRTGFVLYRGINGKTKREKKAAVSAISMLTLEGARTWNTHECWRVR